MYSLRKPNNLLMKLPFLDSIVIESNKLTDYLLNINHPDGGIKAKFLIEKKFDKDSLRNILVKQANEEEVKKVKESGFGTKYILESTVMAPDKKLVLLRSVWIVYLDQKFIKLITAYPIKLYDKRI